MSFFGNTILYKRKYKVCFIKGGYFVVRKVEISNVDTSKLPVLSNEEKDELFKKIKQEI